MADDADRAQPVIDHAVADGLAAARRALEAGLPAVGACHYCSEPLAHGLRFCDGDCRDGWQHEQNLKRMRGVA